jgi:hypothetical protein
LSIARYTQALLAATAALGAASCAVVTIHATSRDDVEVAARFGVVSVQLRPGSGPVLVESTSFGASNSFDGFSVGYRSANLAAMPSNSCRIVLWIRSTDDVKQLNALLGGSTDVCVAPAARADKGGQ